MQAAKRKINDAESTNGASEAASSTKSAKSDKHVENGKSTNGKASEKSTKTGKYRTIKYVASKYKMFQNMCPFLFQCCRMTLQKVRFTNRCSAHTSLRSINLKATGSLLTHGIIDAKMMSEIRWLLMKIRK